MLSILIPLYNYPVYQLVQSLQKQCLEFEIPFEILCQDDASLSIWNIQNEAINELENCSFISLKTNVAHRENRNSLARQAKYPYLLFIDGDSNMISLEYIANFLKAIPQFDVVYGGRLHPVQCPSDHQKLRWKYGRKIEDQSVQQRQIKPYSSLLFNNTLIKKSCFEQIQFDKNMKKYGHDDTQLAYQLQLKQAAVTHINNPIEHGDIDSNEVYLHKTEQSLENLLELYSEQKIDPSFIKMLSLYVILRKTGLNRLIGLLFKKVKKILQNNLLGKNPNMIVFSIYRVGYLCSLE